MAIMHFLQGTYSGALGETVGAGWKGQKTVRTKPISVKDAKSAKQINVRNGFAMISKISSATNEIWLKKYFADVKKMSAYNMLLKANKNLFATTPVSAANVVFPQNYLGSAVPPSATPTLTGQTLTVEMPAASALAQGTPTEYLVCVFQPTTTEDADGNTRMSGEAVAQVLTAGASSVTATFTLPLTATTGDTIYVYTQAGNGTKVNYSTATAVTVA